MSIDLTEIDHIGIAVENLEAAVTLYSELLDLDPIHRERVEDQGVEEVLFQAGTSYIQLLTPLGPDTPIARSLASRGPGLHHIAYRVTDIQAAIDHFRDNGAQLIDEVPRPGSRNTQIAFIHPKTMNGVLVELVQEG
jgi:methylmalonyl-CoA/ethylmalonyl-CoA epimerase